MKNKLAENMLRFGVKNLKESDVKKIEESILTEININGVEYKYPFKDANQLSEYLVLMALKSPDGIMSFYKLDKYDQASLDLAQGLSYAGQALARQTAIEGYTPTQANQIRPADLISRYSFKNMPIDAKEKALNATKNPLFSKYYTQIFTKKWKEAYMTTFPASQTPSSPSVQQQPKVPGKL